MWGKLLGKKLTNVESLLIEAGKKLEKLGYKLPVENVEIKYKNLEDDVIGEFVPNENNPIIIIDKKLEERRMKAVLFHEIGEMLLYNYWIGSKELEEVAEKIKKNKMKVLEDGKDLIFYLLSKKTNISKEALEEIYTSKNLKDLKKVFNRFDRYHISPNSKYTKEILEEVGRGYIYNKLDTKTIKSLFRWWVSLLLGEHLDVLYPPIEIVYKMRKLKALIKAGEKRLTKVREMVRELPPLEEEESWLSEKISVLQEYFKDFTKYVHLRTYKEGLCEYIMLYLYESLEDYYPKIEEPICPPTFYLYDNPILHERELYDAGCNIFLRLERESGLTKGELIKIAIQHKNFLDLKKRLGI